MKNGSNIIFRYSYRQMMEELEKLWRIYPGKVRIESVGWSWEGRCIPEVILGKKNAGHHILVQAGIHGREYMNSRLMIRLMEEYLECPGRAEVCFHVLPMVNPDGATIAQEGMNGIRRGKIRQEFLKYCESFDFGLWKANARGVDINRNFDAGWEEYEGMQKPGREGFKGTKPASEPETRAVLKAAERYTIDCCISYHSSGSLVYWDYGSEGAVYKAEKRLAEVVGRNTGYPLESTVKSCVDAAGCSDYFVRKLGIPAVTIETGKGECPLREPEFEDIYQRNRNLWKALAEEFTESEVH